MRGVSDSRVGVNTKNWTFNAFCLPFEEFKSHFVSFCYNHAFLHCSIKKLQMSIVICKSHFSLLKKGLQLKHTGTNNTVNRVVIM